MAVRDWRKSGIGGGRPAHSISNDTNALDTGTLGSGRNVGIDAHLSQRQRREEDDEEYEQDIVRCPLCGLTPDHRRQSLGSRLN